MVRKRDRAMGRTSFLWSTTTWAGAVLLVALASVISGGWSSVGASASLSIPAPKIVAAPSNPSDDQNPELSFKDAKFPDISFSCRLDQGPVVQCTGDTDHDGDRDQGEIQYRRLAPGPHCFHVFAVGRTHGVSPTTTFCWTISETNSATSISTVSGTPQFTAVNTMFGSLLVARVRDSPGHAVDGAKVTFTAPATGVSGTFASCAGGNPEPYACVVTTNASGLATSSAFTADANFRRILGQGHHARCGVLCPLLPDQQRQLLHISRKCSSAVSRHQSEPGPRIHESESVAHHCRSPRVRHHHHHGSGWL